MPSTIYVTNLNIRSIRGMKDVTLRAFKYVDKDFTSPMYYNKKDKRKLVYTPGTVVTVNEWNSDESEDCGAGINVATRKWVERNISGSRHKILVVEFRPIDIVAVPNHQSGSGGKFRVKKCKVISETALTPPSKGRQLYVNKFFKDLGTPLSYDTLAHSDHTPW